MSGGTGSKKLNLITLAKLKSYMPQNYGSNRFIDLKNHPNFLISSREAPPAHGAYRSNPSLSNPSYSYNNQSSSSFMLPNANQYKAVDGGSGTSTVDTSDYQESVGANTLKQEYHNTNHYTAQNNLLSNYHNYHNNNIPTSNSNANQYYQNHYNLMPTPSSKSSSPVSSTSTPSPRNTNKMLTNQHTQPAVAGNHLNHHYIDSNVASSTVSQQQQISQQYSYSQQHLNASNHEQAYVHHQHHHQHQHQHQHHHQIQHQTLQQQQQLSQQQQHPLQQQQQQLQQHQQIPSQQSIYPHLANNAASAGVNHIYSGNGNSTHYQGHLQGATSNHLSSLIPGAHQNHLNTAAAACAAAAVVSQTLKTVANQHNQQHQYNGSITNGFGTNTGSLMSMTVQNHQQFHSINSLNHHQNSETQQQQQQQLHLQQQPQSNLPVHHATSIVTRKYQCKMCPQVFMSKAEMKYHNQNHMREAKPYKCIQCPKAFANSSYLSQHMRIHQGVKPYSCDICSRKFTQLSHLQQHKRTHTGDKPYKCNYMNCTKQFSQLSNLQSHSRCHQLDKPYKCNSCYKCFHDEQSLLEHIPRHLESKHLKKNLCIFCGSSYQQERGLVKHFQQYHTEKSPTLVAAAIAAGTTGNTSLIAQLVSNQSNHQPAFVTPPNGGSSSSSSSLSSSGSLNVNNNHSGTLETPAGQCHHR